MAPAPADLRIHEVHGVRIAEAASPAGAPDVAAEVDVLVTGTADPPRPWVSAPVGDVLAGVEASPVAAATLAQVLRATEASSVADALAVESLAYSTLQNGEVFQRWLADRGGPRARPATGEPLRLHRRDGCLEVVLDRPEVHNALGAPLRDALVDAFDLVAADPSIVEVHLRGAGPSFCSGGDLDEFGTATDGAAAHVLRVRTSVGRRVHAVADRVTAHVHGACIGAGVEISAFAGRVVADPGTVFRLPEVAMGLVPGAGGTVSLPRRIGRHRTCWLGLTGHPLDATTALAWGLVDEVAPGGG